MQILIGLCELGNFENENWKRYWLNDFDLTKSILMGYEEGTSD